MIKPWRSPAFRVQALAVLVAAFAMTAMLIRATPWTNDSISEPPLPWGRT